VVASRSAWHISDCKPRGYRALSTAISRVWPPAVSSFRQGTWPRLSRPGGCRVSRLEIPALDKLASGGSRQVRAILSRAGQKISSIIGPPAPSRFSPSPLSCHWRKAKNATGSPSVPGGNWCHFSLACPAGVRHNTRQIHTFDEAAIDRFGPFVSLTDAARPLSGEVEMIGMAREVRELREKRERTEARYVVAQTVCNCCSQI
jgi:hypothetical protein